ncbi:MAG: adenylate/guanylate cyclase domain-containing protein [Anaerolineae bacterium]|nr:AAA family ATPase [Thermoflexales bacterium]MDW8407174.1 adenylate/guanylate cyclase domain-containing protein [Anaerolineae bacterium]
MNCPNCGFDRIGGMKYCGRCGARLAHICPLCSFANPLDYHFCGMCGTRLTEGAVYEAVTAGRPWERTDSTRVLSPPMHEAVSANDLSRQVRLTENQNVEAARPARPLPVASSDANPPPPSSSSPSVPHLIPLPAAPLIRAFDETFALAGYQTKPLEGERRIATVILADVRDSTRLLEQLGSETWVDVMNHVFQLLEAEIYRFGGQVNQFRGDGLVAFFGASVAHEDDPERAVLAALAMQDAIKPYAATLARTHGVDLKLRVGVNTGEVIVTTVGDSRQYKEDTAMGQAVAVAARMETAAEPGTVLVSDNTYQLVAPRFRWKSMGQITVKGVSEPIAVYQPLEHQPDGVSRFIEPKALPSVLSRAAQIEAVERCIADVLKGRGGICFISGEKGMGKSFIVARAARRLFDQGLLDATCLPDPLALARDDSAARPVQGTADRRPAAEPLIPSGRAEQVLWLHGFCRSYSQDWPFSVWRDLARRWLGAQSLTDLAAPLSPRPLNPAEAEASALLRQRLHQMLGERANEYYPYLAALLALPVDETQATSLQHLDAEAWQRQFFQAVRAWLSALAERHPLVIVFSDLHWADPSSIELLRFCLPLCDSAPILWLAVFRPDRMSPVWSFRHHVETEYPHRLTRVELPPLTEAESGQLIDELVGPDALSSATRALVIQRAEGNPYFIKELIHALIAEGSLAQDQAGQWRETRRVSSLDLPDSLHGLLAARIDRLSPDQRRVLQIAAVIGPVFWRNMLAALAGESMSAQLQSILTALQRAQLIHERGAESALGMEYAFTSTLVRDVAYESLLATQRANWHLQAAEYLEAGCGGVDLEQQAGLIAWHYRCANRPNKELFYSLLAAEHARKVYANTEAIQHYSRAVEILDKIADGLSEDRLHAIRAQRFEALSGRREVLYLVGDLEAAHADSRALLPLARVLDDDPAWLVDALLAQPEVADFSTQAEARAGIAMAQEALVLAQRLGDRRREVNALMRLGNLQYELRDPQWRETTERALDLLRELGDRPNQARLLLGLAFASGMDDLESQEKYLQAAIPICEDLNDKELKLRLLAALSGRAERAGDYTRQLIEYEQPRLRLAREMGNRKVEGHALNFCGQIRALYLGDLEGGLELIEEAIQVWKGFTGVLYPMLRKAQIQTALGRLDEAEATLAEAWEITRRDFTELGRAGWALVKAILLLERGDGDSCHAVLGLTEQVEALVEQALISQQYRMAAACKAASAHLLLAQLSPDDGRPTHLQQALMSSSVALDTYRRFGFVQIIECVSEEILFVHSQTLTAHGRMEEADDYLAQAYGEMQRKYSLIPPDSPYRRTYLENIALHRRIRAAYSVRQQTALVRLNAG